VPLPLCHRQAHAALPAWLTGVQARELHQAPVQRSEVQQATENTLLRDWPSLPVLLPSVQLLQLLRDVPRVVAAVALQEPLLGVREVERTTTISLE